MKNKKQEIKEKNSIKNGNNNIKKGDYKKGNITNKNSNNYNNDNSNKDYSNSSKKCKSVKSTCEISKLRDNKNKNRISKDNKSAKLINNTKTNKCGSITSESNSDESSCDGSISNESISNESIGNESIGNSCETPHDTNSMVSDDVNSNFETSEDVIAKQLSELELEELTSEVLTLKKDLLTVYLINLNLYNGQSENEKEFSPIKDDLLKMSILIEKLCQVEEKAEIEVSLLKEERRDAPKYILQNKGHIKYRKKEERNPRVKNKRKASELFARGKKVYDNNISDKRTRTNKFD